MKKLLSLLSILTISGAAISTTTAVSSYEKKEIIKNGKVNYQWTNNLENLSRNKRELSGFNKWWTDKIWDPVKNNAIDPVNKVWTDNVFDPAKNITQNCLDNMGNMLKEGVIRAGQVGVTGVSIGAKLGGLQGGAIGGAMGASAGFVHGVSSVCINANIN